MRCRFVLVATTIGMVARLGFAQCTPVPYPKFLPTSGGQRFGEAVATAGERVAVGHATDSIAGQATGSVSIFTFFAGAWSAPVKFTGADSTTGDGFGCAVAMDGDRLIVGAKYEARPGGGASSYAGCAYIFRWTGASWTQEGKLVASDAADDDQFGTAVDISGDRAIVGSPRDDDAGAQTGAAYVFRWDGSAWTQEAKLVGTGAFQQEYAGTSVAISGTRAAVGAPGYYGTGFNTGAVYPFAYNGAAWIAEPRLAGSQTSPNDEFGLAVAMEASTLIATAPGDFANGIQSGQAYVFDHNGSAWGEQQRLAPPDQSSNQRYGTAAAMAGTRALIGSLGDFGGVKGSAYWYHRAGTVHQFDAKIQPADTTAADDYVGAAIACSEGWAVLGNMWDDDVGFDRGAAYTFAWPLPSFLRHPIADSETQGQEAASFSIVAQGQGAITYQWRKDGAPLSDGPAPGGGLIIGATTNALILTAPASSAAGMYDCLISNACTFAPIASTGAMLTVNPPAGCLGDANHDGVVSFADITSVLSLWQTMCQ